MNMHWVDWTILGIVVLFFSSMAYFTKKYVQSTTDFLAANRCAGRYLLTMADSIIGIGTVSVVAMWQLIYKSGFASSWWWNASIPVIMLISLSGWVIYRYRETRVLTMAQFFEIRYSRNFRIVAGMVCWISGILNFGIFPAVGAHFFIYFCGLPDSFSLAILGHIFPCSTYVSIIVILVIISLYFTCVGGQIAILLTDFCQAFFSNIVMTGILIFLLLKFSVADIFDGLVIIDSHKSLVNPFDAGKSDFNAWFFLIGMVSLVVNRLSWQGAQGFNCSAKSPHEAKMAGVIGNFRAWGFMYVIVLIPLVAYMIMHHPKYSTDASHVQQLLNNIENGQVRDQMLVPMTMTLYMPIGLMGAFVAVMFAAFVSTHDTYLHSWGSIFVQDVIIPLRKKPFSAKEHIWALRLSISFVALFIILFSCYFKQTQDVLHFFAITGAIWLGGAGAMILGGLYTRWGTTAGAYAALLSGSIVATTGIICTQYWQQWYGRNFFLTGQEVYFVAIVASFSMYTLVSVFTKRSDFNLDKMLHRGKWKIALETETESNSVSSKLNWRTVLGVTKDFSFGDKLICVLTIVQSSTLFIIFLVMTILAIWKHYTDKEWRIYNQTMLWVMVVASIIISIWLAIGGMRDFIRMLTDIKMSHRDFADDGRVDKLDSTPVQSEIIKIDK